MSAQEITLTQTPIQVSDGTKNIYVAIDYAPFDFFDSLGLYLLDIKEV